MSIKCSNCDICKKQVPAELMCTLTVDEERFEKVCLCVCKDCKTKFLESIEQDINPKGTCD